MEEEFKLCKLMSSHVNKFSLSDTPARHISCLSQELSIDVWQAGWPQSLLHHLERNKDGGKTIRNKLCHIKILVLAFPRSGASLT